MDEGAVSSNALVSILLDGGVVKDWCKRSFYSIALRLRDICIHYHFCTFCTLCLASNLIFVSIALFSVV